MYAEDLVQTCVCPVLAASDSVTLYEPCSIDFKGFVLLVSIPFGSYTSYATSSKSFLEL